MSTETERLRDEIGRLTSELAAERDEHQKDVSVLRREVRSSTLD